MKPIKIGLVGIGRAGYGMHTRELKNRKDKFEFVAGCDEIFDRAEDFSKEFNAKAYKSIKELVLDPDVELVDIATFSKDHFEHAKCALLAGKDVFLEKPFVMRAQEGEELFRLSSQPKGPRLYIRHNRRFEHAFETVNNVIESGVLGEVYEIKLTRNSYQRRNDWQTLGEYGGGQISNWGPHIIDQSLQFCGGDYTEIFSDLKKVTWSGDRDDHIKIVFKGINNRIVDMEISNGVALPMPEYVAYGTRGTLVIDKDIVRMKYLDPEFEPEEAPAVSGAWPEYKNPVFSIEETLPWVEEEKKLSEIIGDDGNKIWDALYETIRNHKPYPIKNQEALNVIKVIEKVCKGTMFECIC